MEALWACDILAPTHDIARYGTTLIINHSFISNLSDDRSTAPSKTIPPLNAI
jgi:hypothetical protein